MVNPAEVKKTGVDDLATDEAAGLNYSGMFAHLTDPDKPYEEKEGFFLTYIEEILDSPELDVICNPTWAGKPLDPGRNALFVTVVSNREHKNYQEFHLSDTGASVLRSPNDDEELVLPNFLVIEGQSAYDILISYLELDKNQMVIEDDLEPETRNWLSSFWQWLKMN